MESKTPTEWMPTSVSSLIEGGVLAVGDGYRAKNSELAPAGLPFARAQNINDGFHFEESDRVPPEILAKVGEKKSQAGDALFTSKGTVGRFAWVREETERFVYSPQLCYWRSKDWGSLDPRFLFFWLQGLESRRQMDVFKGQTDMADYVSLQDQRAMKVTLPTVSEQRRIAWVLGSLDDKIELNQRICRSLVKIGSALALSPAADLVTQPLDELADVSRGTQAKPSEDGVLPFVRGRDLKGLITFPEDCEKITEPTKFVDAGGSCVVMAIGASVGEMAYVPDYCMSVSTGNAALIRPSAETRAAVYFGLRNVDLMDWASRHNAGSAQPYVPIKQFGKLSISVPTNGQVLAAQRAALDLAVRMGRESRGLTKVRDALLPKLISGKIRVPEGVGLEEAAAN